MYIMIKSPKNTDERDASIEIGELKDEVLKVRVQRSFAKQGNHHDAEELPEQLTKISPIQVKKHLRTPSLVQNQ